MNSIRMFLTKFCRIVQIVWSRTIHLSSGPKKSFTSSISKPDVLFEAMRCGVNVFAVHTALDAVREGLNFDLAARLGLMNITFLSSIKNILYKIIVFVPASHLDKVREAMSKAGAGKIGNYSGCSFTMDGKGSFLPNEMASPYVGQSGKLERVDEARLEMVVGKSVVGPVVNEMLKAHPYEEVAYDIYPLLNNSIDFGFGAIGELDAAVTLGEFISRLKRIIGLDSIKVSYASDMKIKKVALCAGSGISFYSDAVRKDADLFITGDVKHHDFREAKIQRTILADATHLGSEKFVPEVMYRVLKKIFTDTITIETSKLRTINAITI